MTSDLDLLRRFALENAQDAFAEIVRRHLNLVYSAALRQVRSPQLAEEIAQSVFADLARAAKKLNSETILTAWLYAVTRRTAIDAIRKESRRQLREQTAVEMNSMNATTNDWTQIEPLLDDAMAALDETDRSAILLRYFENKNLREVGEALGTSDDAAQKRVSRAVERLREFFSKRNVTIGASGLAVLISANAVQSAPIGLAATISAAAVLAGTAVHTSTVIAATKTIAMTILQKTLITATLAIVAGAGIYKAHQAAQLQNQIQTFQQQQAPLADQIRQLQHERDDATNQVAGLLAENAQLKSNSNENELLRLRGQVAPAQANARELARLKSTLANQTGKMPDYLTNAMASFLAMAEKFKVKDAQARLARMKEMLNLTDDQAQAISDIMQKHIQNQDQMLMPLMSGNKLTPEQLQAMAGDNDDAEIKALLTPEQQAAYPDYQQAETMANADSKAKAEVTMMTTTGDLDLSQEQQDKVHAALYQLNLNQASATQNPETILAKARASGNSADVIAPQIELQKQNLEDELKALDGILTPEQLKTYQQEQLDMIDSQTSAMKMFLPQTTNAVPQ
jgi:RNA polymerase sigma factor (sigma-70 family)